MEGADCHVVAKSLVYPLSFTHNPGDSIVTFDYEVIRQGFIIFLNTVQQLSD